MFHAALRLLRLRLWWGLCLTVRLELDVEREEEEDEGEQGRDFE